MMRISNTPKRQRGLALVETAITLPFLLFVMLAASEFTHAFVQHTTITKAARDGARHVAEEAIKGGTGLIDLTSELRDDTRRLVVYGNKAGTGTPVVSGLTVSDVTVTDVGGNNLEVSVNYPYTGILGTVLPTFGFGPNISLLFNMNATVTMRGL
jgi:Flp pilus assembly protein TadG